MSCGVRQLGSRRLLRRYLTQRGINLTRQKKDRLAKRFFAEHLNSLSSRVPNLRWLRKDIGRGLPETVPWHAFEQSAHGGGMKGRANTNPQKMDSPSVLVIAQGGMPVQGMCCFGGGPEHLCACCLAFEAGQNAIVGLPQNQRNNAVMGTGFPNIPDAQLILSLKFHPGCGLLHS